MIPAARSFATARYAVLRDLVSAQPRAFLHDYATGLAQHGRLQDGDRQVPSAPCRFADPFMESLLLHLCPRIESECGLRLHPTYSYFRVYGQGDSLSQHTDRPSCEISVTVNLGQQADAPWPIWIDPGAGPIAVELAPGDAMVYRGMDVPHWRDAFAGERLTQVFLHYVDRDGPCQEWKFDRRAGLATLPHVDAVVRKLLAHDGR